TEVSSFSGVHYNFHGFARYETRQEYMRLHTLDHLSEALLIVVVVGAALYEWRKTKLTGS
ncbi:MAG: hypothetical protein ACREBW_07745, partial [Candidatus Micrarchaeaceae archaeon]